MGKLLLMPLRKAVIIEGLPDLTLTLTPGADVAPGDIVFPVSPGTPPVVTTPPPVVVPVPPVPVDAQQFSVSDIGVTLPWDHANDPTPKTHPKNSLTFHWEGGDALPAHSDTEVAQQMVGIAINHIARQWAPGVYGSGIMYHEVICPSGNSLVMRDYTDVVWHCGDGEGNLSSRAILVYCSDQTPPTGAQLHAVQKRIADFSASMGTRIPAYPHSKWSPTQCPGNTIRALLGF